MNIRKQKGISIIGFIMVLAITIFAAIIAMRIGPIYVEYFSVVKAMEGVAAEPGSARYSPYKLRLRIMNRLYVSYSENVKETDIKVSRGDGINLRIAYQVREPLMGNLDVIATFDKSVKLSN